MAARETENNACAKFCGDNLNEEHYGMLWYFLVSGVVNFNLVPRVLSLCN